VLCNDGLGIVRKLHEVPDDMMIGGMNVGPMDFWHQYIVYYDRVLL
jgi:hypothetical protein